MAEPGVERWRSAWILAFVALLTVTLGIAWFFRTIPIPFNYEFAYNDYASWATSLFLVALIVERFIEIFLGLWRSSGKIELQTRIDSLTDPAERRSAEKALAEYRLQTNKYAMVCAFLLGWLMSLTGIRSLHPLFDTNALLPLQQHVFNSIDVVLTAGLIAGGSNGVNKLTNVLGNFLEATAKRAQSLPSIRRES